MLIGDDVAEECHAERDDPAGGEADQQPCDNKLLQTVREAAQRDQDRRGGGRSGDAGIFAEPVADRSDDQLNRAVGQRIGPHRGRRRGDRHAEIRGDLRQQGIGDANH